MKKVWIQPFVFQEIFFRQLLEHIEILVNGLVVIYQTEVGAFLGAKKLRKQQFQATCVFGGNRASSRRKPRPCEDSSVHCGKTFCFIFDYGSLVLDKVLWEWKFPFIQTAWIALSVLCAWFVLVSSRSFLKRLIFHGPCVAMRLWLVILTLSSFVLLVTLLPVRLDQKEENDLLTPSCLFPFPPPLSFSANASIQPFPSPKNAVINFRELKKSTANGTNPMCQDLIPRVKIKETQVVLLSNHSKQEILGKKNK